MKINIGSDNIIKFIILITIITLIVVFIIKFNNNLIYKNENNINKNITVYIDNNKQSSIPIKNSGFIFDKSICTDDNVVAVWDNNNWNYSISNITKVVSCSLYFKTKPVIYLVDQSSIGQFVDYIPPIGKSSESKNCMNSGYFSEYSGWRILSKNGSGEAGVVTLIHAGSPECYFHSYGQSSESVINLNNIGNAYVNNNLASSGRNIDCNDLKTYDGNACISDNRVITNNIIKTGAQYWLSTYNTSDALWIVDYNGNIRNSGINTLGVRPVIALKSGIKITGGLGSNENPFEISN